ncbi:MAG: DUF1810 domain-containing protein [Tractidigestivibacter sp.]|jgi:uncharacterized protein (DUF1810 family)|uniref:DUF1810 domain-containing protein n=1 Tax=Tractidigestivibacter sp. TaxID=2847320 RepID=UPI003D8C09A6
MATSTYGYDLERFVKAQRRDFDTALAEIRSGHKRSHWIWYIFPQLKELGYSSTAKYYGIEDADEARAFLAHPYLGANLRTISSALLELPTDDPHAVMGHPDDLKLRSSMTLFDQVASSDDAVFSRVLKKFYDGRPDPKTLELLGL